MVVVYDWIKRLCWIIVLFGIKMDPGLAASVSLLLCTMCWSRVLQFMGGERGLRVSCTTQDIPISFPDVNLILLSCSWSSPLVMVVLCWYNFKNVPSMLLLCANCSTLHLTILDTICSRLYPINSHGGSSNHFMNPGLLYLSTVLLAPLPLCMLPAALRKS